MDDLAGNMVLLKIDISEYQILERYDGAMGRFYRECNIIECKGDFCIQYWFNLTIGRKCALSTCRSSLELWRRFILTAAAITVIFL